VLDPENHATGAARRRDHRRSDVPRQYRDEGYLKNEKATREAFAGAGFIPAISACSTSTAMSIIRTGSKDIIIFRRREISSVEVEDVLYKHPAVLFAAVVAKPDTKWAKFPAPSSS